MNPSGEILREFKESDILKGYNPSPKSKILLCGFPGTGKTLTAQAISSTAAMLARGSLLSKKAVNSNP